MLNIHDISSSFEARKDAIVNYERETSDELVLYRGAIPNLNDADISLNNFLPRYSGAMIFEPGVTIRQFQPAQSWGDRDDAMEWVDSVLSGVPVGSVDGSQIYPDKNRGIPIAVVQIGSVYNRHTISREYAERVSATLITPDEFADAGVYAFGKEFVDARRFVMECDALIDLMRTHDSVYLLLDGSLILSHINVLSKNIKEMYLDAMMRLLDASNETKNPIIGYVDVSVQRDVITLMRHIYALKETKRLFDPVMFADELNWGDRTKAFICNRDDRRGTDNPSVLDAYMGYREGIAFFYMRMGDLPSRIEFPVWCAGEGAGEIDRIADIVRAETIIRGSYPDILMIAHRNAVIARKEHEVFYGMLNRFCAEQGIAVHAGAKQEYKERDRRFSSM